LYSDHFPYSFITSVPVHTYCL